MTRRETAERAISKAVELRPVVIQVDNDFWAVQGSKPGHGYLVERDPAAAQPAQHGFLIHLELVGDLLSR